LMSRWINAVFLHLREGNLPEAMRVSMGSATLPGSLHFQIPADCVESRTEVVGDTLAHMCFRQLVTQEDKASKGLILFCRWLLERGAPVQLANSRGERVSTLIAKLEWDIQGAEDELVRKAWDIQGTQLGDLLPAIRSLPPPLIAKAHKGQAGRVGVLGGSWEYTGAPFYASVSSLKVGADLAFIFCHEHAAGPIKCYSPELVVYPAYPANTPPDEAAAALASALKQAISRMHTLVVGPGLGRDPGMQQGATLCIQEARTAELGLVIDADGLQLLCQNPTLLAGYSRAILTPNRVEFSRLCSAVGVEEGKDPIATTAHLARALNGPTVVRKGEMDIISNGTATYLCTEPGSLRRCGGQGDVLSGSAATWLHWALQSGQPDVILTLFLLYVTRC